MHQLLAMGGWWMGAAQTGCFFVLKSQQPICAILNVQAHNCQRSTPICKHQHKSRWMAAQTLMLFSCSSPKNWKFELKFANPSTNIYYVLLKVKPSQGEWQHSTKRMRSPNNFGTLVRRKEKFPCSMLTAHASLIKMSMVLSKMEYLKNFPKCKLLEKTLDYGKVLNLREHEHFPGCVLHFMRLPVPSTHIFSQILSISSWSIFWFSWNIWKGFEGRTILFCFDLEMQRLWL